MHQIVQIVLILYSIALNMTAIADTEDPLNSVDSSRLDMAISVRTLIEKKEILEQLTKVTDAFASGFSLEEHCELKNVVLDKTTNDVEGKQLLLTIHGKGDLRVCDPTAENEDPVTDTTTQGLKILIRYELSMEDWRFVAKITDVQLEADNPIADFYVGLFSRLLSDPLGKVLNDAFASISQPDFKRMLLSQVGITSVPGHLTPIVEVFERGLFITINYTQDP